MQNGKQNQELAGALNDILRYRITLVEDYYWFVQGAVSLREPGWLTGKGDGWPTASQREPLCWMGLEDGERLKEG